LFEFAELVAFKFNDNGDVDVDVDIDIDCCDGTLTLVDDDDDDLMTAVVSILLNWLALIVQAVVAMITDGTVLVGSVLLPMLLSRHAIGDSSSSAVL
jgi:hypothetical protein